MKSSDTQIHGGQGFAKRSDKKLFFNQRDMDFYLSWVIGREVIDGSNREECFAIATQIADGNPESWRKTWFTLAERIETFAEDLFYYRSLRPKPRL
jgi:hypothetical protein